MSPESLLLRQVHPQFVQNGRITSQVFRPTEKDEGKLSVDDGEQIDAFRSFTRYTTEFKLASIGVMAVTSNECNEDDLHIVPDGIPYPDHCYVDFTSLTDGEAKKKAKKLADKAIKRGWLYQFGAEAATNG